MDDDIRPTGATPTTPQVPGAAIATMLARHEIRRAERIAAQEPVPDDTPAAVEGPHIWDRFKDSAADVRQMIRLTIPRFLDLVRLMVEKATPHRGYRPYFDMHDSLFALLVCYRTGWGPSLLAATFNMSNKRDALQTALVRARKTLHEVLIDQQPLFTTVRPIPQTAPPYMTDAEWTALPWTAFHIGLAVDATPCPLNRPKIAFEQAKQWWDTHHGCYSMKLEVGVSTAPPHYAVAWSKLEPGSVADITLHRVTVAHYSSYLRFSAMDTATLAPTMPAAGAPDSWTMLADSAYNGQVTATFPRIALPKLPVVAAIPVTPHVRYLRSVRVIVEQYFGRMKMSWEIMSVPYLLGTQYHQEDVDNVLVLTNILLRDSPNNPLNDADRDFYLKELQLLKLREETRRLKAVEAAKRCRAGISRQVHAIQEAVDAAVVGLMELGDAAGNNAGPRDVFATEHQRQVLAVPAPQRCPSGTASIPSSLQEPSFFDATLQEVQEEFEEPASTRPCPAPEVHQPGTSSSAQLHEIARGAVQPARRQRIRREAWSPSN